MKRCNSCNIEGLNIFKLAYSDSTSPARCKNCGDKYYLSGSFRYPISLVFNFGLFIVIFSSFVFGVFWPLVLFICSWPLSYIIAAKITNPVHTTDQEVKQKRKIGYWFLGVIGVLIVVTMCIEYL
ncbi:MAG: hypothetical protein ACI9IA_001010 [Enterobacterales bacterium]